MNDPNAAASGLTAPVAEFLGRVHVAHPDLDLSSVVVRKYGDTASMSRRILAVILSGAKTGGFAPWLRYERTGAPPPRVGQLCVVTEFDGTPALLYELVEVEVLPFASIDEGHTAVEAPELRDLEAWRRFHRTYWSREFEQYGVEPSDAMLVLYQRFRVLHPRPAAATPTTP